MSSSYSNSRNKPRPNSRSTKTRSSGVKYGSNPQGRVVEISTVDEDIQGIFSAMSPLGDVAISKSKNGVSSDELKVIQTSSIKRVVSKDCDDQLIKGKFETDGEIALNSGMSRSKIDDDFSFEPYFNISEKLDMQEDFLETEKDGQHWFPPESMFEVNQKQFNVLSSYDDALSSYTIALDKSQPNYAEKSARAEKIAHEIELNTHSCHAADLENDDGLDDEDEEKMHSAVIRPSQSQSSNVGIGRGKQSNSRAEAFKNAFTEKPRNTFNRHGSSQRNDERKFQKPFSSDLEKSKDKVQPVERSTIKSQSIESDIDNIEKLTPDQLESKTPDVIPSDVSIPISKLNEDCVIPQSPELSEMKSDNNDLQKKTSLNPEAPEFKPQARPAHVDNPPFQPGPHFQVPVSYAAPNQQYAVPQQHSFSFPVHTINQQTVVVPGSVPNGSKMMRNQMTNVQAIGNQQHPPSLPSPHQAKFTLQRSGEVTSAQQPLVGPPLMMVQNNNLQHCFIPQVPKYMSAKPTQPSQHQATTSINSSQNFHNQQQMSNQAQQQPTQQQQHVPQPQSHMAAQPTQQIMFIQQPGFTHSFPSQHPMLHMMPNQHQAVHHQPSNILQTQGHAGVTANNPAAPLYYPFCTNGASMTTHAMHPGTTISSMPNHQSQYYQIACPLPQNTVQVRPASFVHQSQMHAMPTASNVNFNHSQSAQSVSFMPRPHNQHPNS